MTKLKIIGLGLLVLCVFAGGLWLVRKYTQDQTEAQVKAWQDQAGQKAQEALEAKGRAEQLAQEVQNLNLEIQSANERARIAEARLVEARAARVQLERAYAGIKAQTPNAEALAVPITPQERSQLCQKLKDLGKLPESFKCP